MPAKSSSQTKTRLPWWGVAAFWIGLALAVIWLLGALKSILLPFVAGTLLAYLLDPWVDHLEKRRWRRSSATAVVLGGVFTLFVLAMVLILPPLVEQLGNFVAALPEMVDKIRQLMDEPLQQAMDKIRATGYVGVSKQLGTAISSQGTKIAAVMTEMVGGLWHSGLAFLNILSLLLITPLVAFYFLRDWDVMKAKLDELLPRRHADTVRRLMHESDYVLSGFIRGQMNVCLILGVYYALALTIAGLPYALLIGLVAGFLAFIPYIGTATGLLTGMAVAWFHAHNWQYVAVVACIFGAAQLVEGNFLTPRIVGEKVGLHPVWVMFGMLAGGALLGLVGVLIAVPTAAVIGVLVRFAIAQYKQSQLYLGEGRRG
ncbi:AI-2E family transporter [bacterium]|nr:AI-2E family transporter [bacterium]